MPSFPLTAGKVMNSSAALLNDVARSQYTYTVQVPYLRLAMNELQELFELNSIPVSESVSTVIQVDAGDIEIGFEPGKPQLPSDFVEPNQLWERTRDINPFTRMTRKDYLPHELEGVESNQLIYYVWQDQKIKFLPANADNDVKIDYIREFFTEVVNENSLINVINAKTFLEYRTAGLVAKFVENNSDRASELDNDAGLALDRATGIGVKSKQAIMTRRRPFRASYKRRGWVT